MKPLILCSLLGISIAVASAKDSSKVAIDQSSHNFAAISVADLTASADWYQKHFALKKSFSYHAEDGSVTIEILSSPGLTIELQHHLKAQSISALEQKSYLNHGIFKYGVNVVNVHEAIELLKQNKVKIVVDPFDDQNSQFISAIIEDNSGNLIQLFEKKPAAIN